MYQRHLCTSMGAARRSLLPDVAAVANCSSRTFHTSARRLEEKPSAPLSSAPASLAPRNDRKARTATAMKQLASLQNRRPPPNGQLAQRRTGTPQAGQTTSGPPRGTMIRAPSKLRITRNTTVGGARPAQRARTGNRGEGGPSKRERKPKSQSGGQMELSQQAKLESSLPDGMVQQLLRIQRKEWDRVAYEPKYAPGSFAANELIHAGRELFRGESAPVKVWGPLERKIGVVGMHGAAAALQIRRVPDGDSAPFGKEDADEAAEETKTVQK